MLLCVLIPVTMKGIAVNVMHAPFIPALVGVVGTETQGQAVSQPEGLSNRIVVTNVSVQPCSVPLRRLVSVIMVLENIKKSWVLEIHA